MKWLWIALAGLLAVAAGATWFAFSDPTFWTGLVAAIVANIIPILFKLKADYKAENAAYRRDEELPTKQRPHPNEGGHR